MNISTIVDQNYASVSILDDTRHVMELLRAKECFAVIDEELRTVGIITLADIVRDKSYQLIDFIMDKPQVSPEHTVEDVCRLMEVHDTAFLPVFESHRFIGIISLSAITGNLLLRIQNLERQLNQH